MQGEVVKQLICSLAPNAAAAVKVGQTEGSSRTFDASSDQTGNDGEWGASPQHC